MFNTTRGWFDYTHSRSPRPLHLQLLIPSCHRLQTVVQLLGHARNSMLVTSVNTFL